jgi:hypothetical protein
MALRLWKPSTEAHMTARPNSYHEPAEFDEATPLTRHVFRGQPFTLNEREAETDEQRVPQTGSPAGGASAFDAEKPPEVRPFLAELNFDDEDILEGLELPNHTP